MQIGMIGLGRMGANMVKRLLRDGHECVVYDRSPDAVEALVEHGAKGSSFFQQMVAALKPPRVIWLMVPAAAVDAVLSPLKGLMEPGDILVDGGNTHYLDDLRRATALSDFGIAHLDVGTSGGVAGGERGYCLMIGGSAKTVRHLAPLFTSLAPGSGTALATPGRSESLLAHSTADQGWLHCGPHGAGHFVKMVHNGIEYGLMAAYAEGMNILKHANIGLREHAADAETTPLRQPAHYPYEFDLPEIAELWRRGSVISSWLLDLSAAALAADHTLESYEGHVSDSGEGRWAVQAAIDEAVPVPVLSAALYARFDSRGRSDFANRLQSAMRHEFGGHAEKPAGELLAGS